jgi:hypothetical protein
MASLNLTFDDILNADLLVGDASVVADWNTFFLPRQPHLQWVLQAFTCNSKMQLCLRAALSSSALFLIFFCCCSSIALLPL